MLIYTIEKEGKYFTQYGWSKNLELCMRWMSRRDAETGMDDLRRERAAMMAGAEVVEKSVHGSIARPIMPKHAYDPWGMNSHE